MTAQAKNIRKKNSQPEPSQATQPVWVEMVLARFRLMATRRAAWLQKLWSEESDPASNGAISHSELESRLIDRDSPEAESVWFNSNETIRFYSKELAEIESALEKDSGSRLQQINQIFRLNAQEADLFQVCLAIALDPSLSRVCAYLQDHTGRAYMTEDLAARLLRYGRCSVWSSESALLRWELISAKEVGPGEPCALSCDPQVRDWLLRRETLDESLVGIAGLKSSKPSLRSWPVDINARFVKDTIHRESPDRVRFLILGSRGSGRRTLAANISAAIRLPLLVIDADQVEDQNWGRVFLRAQRHAFLERCSIAWIGESLARRNWPQTVPFFPLQFVICEPGHEPPPVSQFIERRIKMPALVGDERESLWQSYFPSSKRWPKTELRKLAQLYQVNVGDIADAARIGASSPAEAGSRVRQSLRSRLGGLAQLLDCPFDWDDLVIQEPLKDTLRDIAFEATQRKSFWEDPNARRLFPQGRGLIVLLNGPPGTGKTMAAQVIAASLEYDLFRIDLATVVSKYVGETSQNLDRLLSRAADMDVVLLFDEADALFSKRSTEVRDAQDRFANTDTAYLLQAIESYPGIALLASNQKNSIDQAFIRRLRYVLEFSKPDAAQRLKIWQKVVGELAGEDRFAHLAGDLQMISELIETTGAQIKYAMLNAMFICKRERKPLSLDHLLRGLERELMKEGRALTRRDRERMLRNGKRDDQD
ncbi:MAG: ATP-binding protein [Blastocatellia bacterium]